MLFTRTSRSTGRVTNLGSLMNEQIGMSLEKAARGELEDRRDNPCRHV